MVNSIDVQGVDISIMEHHNIHIDTRKIQIIKILEIAGAALFFNLIFATIAFLYLEGQISNATTFIDYFYFGMVSASTVGYGDMTAQTTTAKIIVSIYLLLLFSLILSFAL
jgi:voltage-gated potassium channel